MASLNRFRTDHAVAQVLMRSMERVNGDFKGKLFDIRVTYYLHGRRVIHVSTPSLNDFCPVNRNISLIILLAESSDPSRC